jgi:GntR family transcriptional regulator
MYIQVDPKSSTPLYAQIMEQTHRAAATGILQPGDQAPRVRDLAEQLRVNPNTVARAYRELQAEGLLVARQGSGTFVSDEAEAIGEEKQRQILGERLEEAARLAREAGLSKEEFLKVAKNATGFKWAASSRKVSHNE